MEKDIPYIKIGFFIVTSIVLMIILGLFLAFKSINTSDQTTYAIITEETISGLTIGSPVKFHGLQVGSVSKIDILDQNSTDIDGQLVVFITASNKTPIDETTRAVFEPAGITGQLYVNLTTKDTNNSSHAIMEKYQDVLLIKNDPGLIKKYSEQLSELLKNVNVISKKIGLVLNDDNIKNISQTIQGTNLLISNLNKQADALLPAFEHAGQTMQTANATLQDISKTAKSITAIVNSLNAQLDQGDFNIRPDVDKLKSDISKTTRDADALIKRLDSMLLRVEISPIDFAVNGSNLQAGPGESIK